MIKTSCTKPIFRLAAGQTLALAAGPGTRLSVRSGCAWLTRDRDDRDLVLNAGRDFTIAGDGVIVVQMLAGGVLAIDAEGERASSRVSWLGRLRARLHAVLPMGEAPVVSL